MQKTSDQINFSQSFMKILGFCAKNPIHLLNAVRKSKKLSFHRDAASQPQMVPYTLIVNISQRRTNRISAQPSVCNILPNSNPNRQRADCRQRQTGSVSSARLVSLFNNLPYFSWIVCNKVLDVRIVLRVKKREIPRKTYHQNCDKNF